MPNEGILHSYGRLIIIKWIYVCMSALGKIYPHEKEFLLSKSIEWMIWGFETKVNINN